MSPMILVPIAIGLINGAVLDHLGVEFFSLTWWVVTIPVCYGAGVAYAKLREKG